MSIELSEIYGVEMALRRLATMVGQNLDWMNLQSFLPVDIADGLIGQSALASTFAASLELAREGKIELQQTETFGPIYLRYLRVEI
jgi:segregation and condensation protein A